MRRALPALVLALGLTACSAGTPDTNTGTDASEQDAGVAPTCTPGAQVACACIGGAQGAQVCASDGRSLGPCDCPDTGVDAGPPDAGPPDTGIDAGEPLCVAGSVRACPCPAGRKGRERCDDPRVGFGACDCATPDAGEPSIDSGPRDAGPDIPRVGLDTGPRDTGPVDAQGVQSYPLDPPPGETQVRVLYVETCRDRDGGPCADSVPADQTRNASCRRTGTRLAFAFTPCVSSIPCSGGLSVTGDFPDYRSTAGATVTVVGGGPTQGRDFVIESGSVVEGRQSFRVSFSAPPTSSVPGVTGVPGRTLSPDRGDVWLLGCPVQ